LKIVVAWVIHQRLYGYQCSFAVALVGLAVSDKKISLLEVGLYFVRTLLLVVVRFLRSGLIHQIQLSFLTVYHLVFGRKLPNLRFTSHCEAFFAASRNDC